MESREIYRYTPEEIGVQTECPACGINTTSMKKPFSHAKKCFSIKRPGPLYRIFGYVECECGMLIHDGSKAQKLHVCMGNIPPYDPRVEKTASPPPNQSGLPPPEPAPAPTPSPEPTPSPSPTKQQAVQIMDHKILPPQRKKWIRNFTCPIKQKPEDIQLVKRPGVYKPRLKSVPRVRNFDIPSRVPSDEVSVYSIIQEDESISKADKVVLKVNRGTKELVLIKKQSLRLPMLRKS